MVMREVHTISQLKGDCIIRYYNSKIENNFLYIQMELCDENLKTIIDLKAQAFNRTPFKPKYTFLEYFFSCELFRELLLCLEYLHHTIPVIIHRDLKPANILINYKKNNGMFMKICDFGLAAVQNLKGKKLTSNVGTEKYQAPEVANQQSYDYKVDIYSTGLIAQELFDIDININE